MKEKVQILTKKGKYSFGYKITPDINAKKSKKPFIIPVIDVRDGEEERKLVDGIVKQNNIQKGSMFIKPSYSVMGFSYTNKKLY